MADSGAGVEKVQNEQRYLVAPQSKDVLGVGRKACQKDTGQEGKGKRAGAL